MAYCVCTCTCYQRIAHSPRAVLASIDTVSSYRLYWIDGTELSQTKTCCNCEDKLRDAVVLVWTKKQNLSNAMSSVELVDRLFLNLLRNRGWHIQATCTTQGNGLYHVLDWLCRELPRKKN